MLIALGVALSLLWFLQTRGVGLSIFLRLPSTICHELCHWFIALVTRSQPSAPSVIPIRIKKGVWQLGHVSFQPKVGRAGLVALAPLFMCLPPALACLARLDGTNPSISEAITHGLVAGYVLDACVPSEPDFYIAFKDPLGLLLAVGTLYFASLWAISPLIL